MKERSLKKQQAEDRADRFMTNKTDTDWFLVEQLRPLVTEYIKIFSSKLAATIDLFVIHILPDSCT